MTNTNHKTDARNIVSGTISLTVSVIIVKIIGFFYKVPLSHILGDEGMGYFNSAYTVFSFFYLLCSSGIPKAISIMITDCNINGNNVKKIKILSFAIRVFGAIGFIFTAFLFLFSGFLSSAIGNKNAYISMVCIAPTLLIACVSGVLRGYLTGVSDFIPISLSQVAEGGVKFIIGLLFAMIGIHINASISVISGLTILGVTLGSLISMCILLIATKRNIRADKMGQSETFELFDKKQVLKKIFILSAPITLSAAVMGLSNLIDLAMIIKSLIGIGYSQEIANSLYGNYTTLVVPMINLVVALISPLTVAALPMISGCFYKNDFKGLNKGIEFLVQMTSFVSFPLAAGFCIYSKEILLLLFNDDSAIIAAPLLTLVSPAMIFLPLLTIINTVLEATERVVASLASMGIGATIKIITSYILMRDPDIGIAGAPLGTVISYGISLIISVCLMHRFVKIKISAFKILFKPLFIGFGSIIFSKLVYNLITNRVFSISVFALSVSIAVVFYFLLSIFFGSFSFKKIKTMSKSTKKVENS